MPVVRLFQAALATLACAGVGWLAFLWAPDPTRRVRAAGVAFALAALCPFTAIYTAVVEPEMLTIFLTVALLLAATWAFRARTRMQATLRWVTAGGLAGATQMVRPESGLFAAAVDLTLVAGVLFTRDGERPTARWPAAVRDGAVFSCAFVLVLVPWTWRNARVFHRFSPLPPNAAHLPGARDFHGFNVWYRTWADSEWSLEPYYWGMTDGEPATTADLPDRAFDSADERTRTEALFARYNTPAEPVKADEPAKTNASDETAESTKTDASDASAKTDDSDETAESGPKPLGLTPELEADFGRLGQERADRAPWRQHLILPLRRAWNLWFSPHATYYDFDVPVFPSGNGADRRGHFWPAVFLALLCAYTVLALAGLWRLARAGAWRWVALVVLIVVPRWAYLATMENTEPRYMIEIFPLVCVLGGIALAGRRVLSRALA